MPGPRTKLIAVNVTAEEHAIAKKFAGERRRSVSSWALAVLFGEIDRRIIVTRHADGDISYAGPDLMTMIELTLHIHECEESRKARGAGPTPEQKAEIDRAMAEAGDGGFGW